MSEETLRKKYRVAKLAACLECDGARAAEMARKLSGLDDDRFDEYAAHAADTLAGLKARAGVQGAAPAKEPPASGADSERVRAAVAEFVASEFFELGEDEARHGR